MFQVRNYELSVNSVCCWMNWVLFRILLLFSYNETSISMFWILNSKEENCQTARVLGLKLVIAIWAERIFRYQIRSPHVSTLTLQLNNGLIIFFPLALALSLSLFPSCPSWFRFRKWRKASSCLMKAIGFKWTKEERTQFHIITC